jgi:BirA family transcriptional regulator, biotin operon repressor / biotin---[acetyl-CoA-carboxylase] ligase
VSAGEAPGPGGFRLRRYEEVASTNDLLREAALAGEPEGLWIVASRQTAGRGRHGRRWASPSGNFHGSVLVSPNCALARAASLSLVAALAVAEAVHGLTGGDLAPRLKWPNDVLVGRSKLAGILLESVAIPGAEHARLIIGMGINLAVHPLDADYPTTSLKALGHEAVTAEQAYPALAGSFAHRLAQWRRGGFGALRRAWLDAAFGLGSTVTLRIGEQQRQGRFADLGEDGSLLLENPMGCLERFSAGELFFDLGPQTG